MKKSLNFWFIFVMALMLSGCGSKFEPTESTIFVTSKEKVQSAVMESFEEPYYNFDELYKEIEKEVKAYCLDKNDELVTMNSLVEENDSVSLLMEYQTVEAYAEFNDVLLFSGSFEEAVDAGLIPETLYTVEGEYAEIDLEEHGKLKVIVTEESVCVQTSGKIAYTSDNVVVLDKKLAKAMEAGKNHPAFILYK